MTRNTLTAAVVALLLAIVFLGPKLMGPSEIDTLRSEVASLRAENARLAKMVEAPSMPMNLSVHQKVGRLKVSPGKLMLEMDIYSRVDGKADKPEWDSLACVRTGKGMEVGGRWVKDQRWIAAHDDKHQFLEWLKLPVEEVREIPRHELWR